MTTISRRFFAKNLLGGIVAAVVFPKLGKAANGASKMKIEFIRHATFILEINGKRILVDPMFSDKDTMEALEDASNNYRIPMVELPFDTSHLEVLLKEIDAVIITHTHFDHFDKVAKDLLPKNIQIFCQPTDEKNLTEKLGYTNVKTIQDNYVWNDISFNRTEGKHGLGEIGTQMGQVSGFVLKTKNEPSLYIAGDTVWCSDVENALKTYKPDYTVLNAGGAQFLTGGSITMTAEHVMSVATALPSTKIIAVHMDTINHCIVKRSDLKSFAEKNGIKKLIIPADGEYINIV
jgi:L-ascorbate metabolism protein UlaG (beta-lactamase superfamily)